MSFSHFFYAIISNFFSPFKTINRINEIIKNGFNRKKFFYYSLLLYLLSSISLILSGYLISGRGNFHLLIIDLIIALFLDLFYIFISFSILHFLRTKIDFEHFSALYFLSSYFYFILLPITILINIFGEHTKTLLNLIFFCLSLFIIIIKIYVYSLFVNNSKEKGLLYFILPALFVFCFVFFLFYLLFMNMLSFIAM